MRESVIEEYKELSEICSVTDYSDKKSVRKHNKSASRMIQIAKEISNSDSLSLKSDFIDLLDFTEFRTNVWVAFQLLEHFNVTSDIENKALSIIIELSNSDSTESVGCKIWLENFEKNKITKR